MHPVIYAIVFPDGSMYIGSTTNFVNRKASHRRAMVRQQRVSSRLAKKFQEFGKFDMYKIASVLDVHQMHLVEADVIATMQPDLNVVTLPSPIHLRSEAATPFGPYPSISAAAQAFGTTRQHLRRYGGYEAFVNRHLEHAKKAGLTKRAAKFGPPDPRKNSALINIDGAWHLRSALPKPAPYKHGVAAAVARRHGVAPGTYYVRRHMGWTLMEALNLKPRVKQEQKMQKRYITADGKTMSLDAWAKKMGVSKGLISSRLGAGWTETQAVGVEPRKERPKKAKPEPRPKVVITYKGVTGNISQVCRHFGATDSTVRARIKLGWSLEDAFTIPVAGT